MKRLLLVLFISSSAFLTVNAQDTNDTEQKTEHSADDLAKQLANPNATLGVLFTQFDYVRYSGDIPNAGQNGFVFNFQPSLPIPLGYRCEFIRATFDPCLFKPTGSRDRWIF
jgi:hypothetical protein